MSASAKSSLRREKDEMKTVIASEAKQSSFVTTTKLDCFVGPVSFSPRRDQNQNQNGNNLESNRDHRSCFGLLNYRPDEAIQLSCCGKAGLLRFARNDGETYALIPAAAFSQVFAVSLALS